MHDKNLKAFEETKDREETNDSEIILYNLFIGNLMCGARLCEWSYYISKD